MALTYATNLKNDRLDLVTTYIDAGGSAGILEIGTTGMGTVLATYTLDYPCAVAAAGGVLNFSGFPKTDTDADATGTAAEARIKTSTAVDVITGMTVGTSGTDIILDSVSISVGQTVILNSASITHG